MKFPIQHSSTLSTAAFSALSLILFGGMSAEATSAQTTFTSAGTVPTGQRDGGMATADFNGDGLMDVAAAAHGSR